MIEKFLKFRVPLFLSFLFIFPLIFPSYYTYVFSLIGIYCFQTLSLNILAGITGQLSLGHAAIMAIGAYTTAILSNKFGIPLLLLIPISGLFTAIIGFFIGLPCSRMGGIYLAIATMAFGFAVPEICLKWDSVTGGYSGLRIKQPHFFGFVEDYIALYYLIFLFLILFLWISHNLIASKTGRAFISIRDNEVVAESMGVNLPFYKVLGFVISTFIAGVGGCLYSFLVGFVSPYDFNFWLSIYFLIGIVVGGMGSISGSIIGAIFITLVPQLTSGYKHLPQMILGALLIVSLIFLPKGLAAIPSLFNKKR